MDSDSLKASGFAAWEPFSSASASALVAGSPTSPGVYVIRYRTPFARDAGASDVLYVGSARNRDGLRMRLRQYFHPGPTQATNHRILARCGNSTDYEVSYVECESPEAAAQLEATILARYVSDHGELPPENRVLPSGNHSSAVVNATRSEAMPTKPPKGSTPLRADVVWRRIESSAGEKFKTVTGLPFTYTVAQSVVRPSRTNRQIPRSDFEKALKDVPLKNTTAVQHLQGPSFIYAILMDERIRAGEW